MLQIAYLGVIYITGINMSIMKRLLFLFSVLFSLSAYSQEPLDSVSFAEMEDSISGMSIVPVKKPKELLDSIIEQVILDSQQKPIRCKYQTINTTGLHTSRPTTSSCIHHAIANIKRKPLGEAEEFHYEGPPRLRNLRDTATIYYALRDCLEGNLLTNFQEDNLFNTVPEYQEFQAWMSAHYVKVYCISDEKGRGVYRVDFSPRKYPKYGFHAAKYTGTAYFNKKTFRLIQVKADLISPSSFDIMGRQDKKGRLSHSICRRVQCDFEEVGGVLVVKQKESTFFVDEQLTGKKTVQRLP